MIYAIYFVPRDGVHPHATKETYAKLWPIMHDSVRRLGHSLVHITDKHTPCMGDSVFRVDVDPATTVYSRDVAWRAFLTSLADDGQACMIEPDTVLLRDIPPIADGFDMVLLRRPQKCIPGWFKLGTKRSIPFCDRVLKEWESFTGDLRVFHGDISAIHRACGIKDGDTAHTIPNKVNGVRIEVRDWFRYGFRKSPNFEPYLLQFKGASKDEMLRFA
jgi:hypothetical protein